MSNCQNVNNVKLPTMSNCQQCQNVNQIVTTSNVMYYQSVWIRLAHRLYSDFQYFFNTNFFSKPIPILFPIPKKSKPIPILFLIPIFFRNRY